MQDTLRGRAFASMPFFSQPAVIGLLERLPEMDVGPVRRTIKVLVSMSVLQERLGIA